VGITVKTTLSFTDRHHRFLTEKVGQGVFASQSSAVAAALEQMIRDEEERDMALGALADEIRSRLQTPRKDYVEGDDAFAAARAQLQASREA
jgi:Arc/MetJ-type ribon-helix-helix transcriptional regulator